MNKKGFVLAEAIVVAVFVLGMFTYLAMNIFPLITKYDQSLNYDNPNEVYLVNTLYDELLAANKFDTLDDGIYNFSKEAEQVKVKDQDGNEVSGSIFSEDYFKNMIYEQLNVTSIVVVSNYIDISLKDDLTRGMRQYYNYMQKHNAITGKKSMLLEFENGKYAVVSKDIPVEFELSRCFKYFVITERTITGWQDTDEVSITGWDDTKQGCSSVVSTLVIPQTMEVNGEEKTVTKISNNAFKGRTEIKRVSFPNTINSIGNSAFQDCNISGDFKLPTSLTTLGLSAFQNNKISGDLELPNDLTTVPSRAFSNNDITGLIINDKLTTIENYAFENNSILGQLDLKGVKKIGDSSFLSNKISGSLNLTKVTSIGSGAFKSNRINEVILVDETSESQISSLPYGVFWGNNLTELYISSKVKSIGSCTFYGNYSLKKLEFTPGSELETIGDQAFRSSMIEEVVFPYGLKSIGDNAFLNVTSLKKVVIPETIIEIKRAFISMKTTGTITIKKANSDGITLATAWNGNANVVYDPS